MRRLVLLPLFALVATLSTPALAADGIYKGVICIDPDTAQRIPGALVELDDGQSVVSNDVGYFEFTVAPGTYTATATADGYEANSSTRTVGDGEEVWGSIGLTVAEVGDLDGDGVNDSADNCPEDYNPSQLDKDLDGIGDSCDPVDNTASGDDDGDTVANDVDNCPEDYNPGQADKDLDGIGDACDPVDNTAAVDSDDDGISDEEDNCPDTYNPQQEDLNDNGVGDACDEVSVEPDVITEEDVASEQDIVAEEDLEAEEELVAEEDLVEIVPQDDATGSTADLQEADSGSCDPVQCPTGECQCKESGGCSVTNHGETTGHLWLFWMVLGLLWAGFRRRGRESPSCSL